MTEQQEEYMGQQSGDPRLKIAETIISELEHFDKNFKVEVTPTDTPRYLVFNSQMRLKVEPFVAYVRAEVNGEEKVYLICRNYTPMGIMPETPSGIFLSYKAPLGRVAAMPVGSDIEITTPSGLKYVKIIEKNIFTPDWEQIWDAKNNRLSLEAEEIYVYSLRELINQGATITPALLEADILTIEEVDDLGEAEEFSINLLDDNFKKQRNKIAEVVALRDQSILDEFQDELFRLPISSQLIITGAPGTGKTTVLIKRLSQKSKVEHLSDNEKAGLSIEQIQIMFDSRCSWEMFTPNDLLKNYLKEALSTELLAANENNVKTWSSARINLARDVLKILRTGKTGIYTKSTFDFLSISEGEDLARYVSQFTDYYYEVAWQMGVDAVTRLKKRKIKFEQIPTVDKTLVERVNAFIDKCDDIYRRTLSVHGTNIEDRSFVLFERLYNLSPEFNELKKKLNAVINRTLRDAIIKNPIVLEEVASIITSSSSTSTVKITNARRRQAVRSILYAFIAYGENTLDSQSSSRSDTQIIIWDKIVARLKGDEKAALERASVFVVMIRSALKVVSRMFKGYSYVISNIPKYYHDFRRDLLKREGDGFLNKKYIEEIKEKKISKREIDILIFVMLRDAKRVFQRNADLLYGDTKNVFLEGIKSQYKTQIAVDEATDFSSVQLGCMYHLSHPVFNSVTFVGDLMQRVTTHGLKDWEECKFISDGFQIKELFKAYRQSPTLLSIAKKLYKNVIGQEPSFASAFIDDGQDPYPLKFHSTNNIVLGEWIVQRVLELYELTNFRLPSIAVFVAEDNDIEEVFSIIEGPLSEHSIEVEKCPEGRILGTGSRVRIFSVEYIKGLEFGAVFFINIDHIHEMSPDLVDKYLYVGLTRATTFLGVTYKKNFPDRLSIVEDDFKDGDWSAVSQLD